MGQHKPNESLPKLHLRSKGTRKAKASLSTIFAGLSMRIYEDRREYALVMHDGMGVVGSERDIIEEEIPDDLVDRILKRVKEYATARGHRIAIFAVAGPLDKPLNLPSPTLEVDRDAPQSFLSRIWLELDAIPFVGCVRDTQFSIQGEAVLAIERALAALAPTTSTIMQAATSKEQREVLVDADHCVRLYDLHEQAKLTSPALWDTFVTLAMPLKKNKIKVSFFSATPRGGGVALMRHSLLRIWHLAGLDIHWFVPQGDSAVFEVTKRKFHNVLQGVNTPDVELTKEDKKLFETWTKWNFDKYWSHPVNGFSRAIDADVIVIDDPQLTALIPIIREENPRAKIIYRSHIEVRSDLVDAGKSPQKDVWEYLWGFIKDADLFVSHPVESFVPKCVKEAMPVVYMPPSTDPLDGLNKPIPEHALETYREYFNSLMKSSTGQQLDWQRGYIIQVARFDPSKGIPDLIEGYRLFREAAKEDGICEKAPQLIMIGHTSVDDPDATVVLHELQETIGKDEFKEFRDDIYALRAPPDDRLLDALMRGADLACQVSTREGFEIKVTEAIHKTRWVVATKAGGIPLQIRDGTDGVLVPPSSPKDISAAFVNFYSSGKDRQKTGESRGNYTDRPLGGRWTDEGEGPKEELFSIGNATMWHFLWNSVLAFDTKQIGSLSNKHVELIKRLGLGEGRRDLSHLNGQRVWDMLKVGKDESN